jgi:ectoine hydroxylase-related dioxygenase (phytanoyl-CoA dioxygenase family)
MTATASETTKVGDDVIARYRRDGFVRVPSVLNREDAATYAAAASAAQSRISDFHGTATFAQLLSVWQQDDILRDLTLHPAIAAIAQQLAGVSVRLWHDQLLIKAPHNGAATHFHQDAPYWPHQGSRQALSAWIALVDVPVEKGCMTFIPGSQSNTALRAQDLEDSDDLFSLAPELRWEERVTVPLRAGDCTFHNAYTAHTASPNFTDEPRIAHVVIYIDAATRFSGGSHPLTDPLGLAPGSELPEEIFPALPIAGR